MDNTELQLDVALEVHQVSKEEHDLRVQEVKDRREFERLAYINHIKDAQKAYANPDHPSNDPDHPLNKQ